jgi:hypothetical protein
MALQFFAVHSEALATTHDALQRHASRHGLRPPGPTRALRIAQLYGHLQLRASGRSSLVLAVSELAACWRFQPRQLRQDLALLQALGWLHARGTSRGTVISLSGPEPGDSVGLDHKADSPSPEPDHADRPGQRTIGGDSARDDRAPASLSALPPAPRPGQGMAAPQACATQSAGPVVSEPSASSPAPVAPPPAAASNKTPDLLQRLAALYNQHRPATWPAYQPRGNGLRSKLRQALKQAGSAEALADTLTAALRAMPSFWRHTYPQGRSGAECMAVLFCTDRGCAGLGVEFWHLFSWAQAAAQGPGGSAAIAQQASDSGAAEQTTSAIDDLQRARRLFLWDSGVWRSQGREALLLSLAEKRELTVLLEADGLGIPGTAERQFAEPDGPLPCEEVQGFDPIPAHRHDCSAVNGPAAKDLSDCRKSDPHPSPKRHQPTRLVGRAYSRASLRATAIHHKGPAERRHCRSAQAHRPIHSSRPAT